MLTAIIEALIFASGEGIALETIYNKLTDFTKREINKSVEELKTRYGGENGIVIVQYNGILHMQTNPAYGDILADALQETKEKELSRTLLQVLAIVAYKQPITRAEIEELRGVNSDYVISMLTRLDLVEAIGQKDTVGKPILYATTNEFLRKFKLTELSELPDFDELMHKIRTNFDKYYEKRSGLYRERDIEDEEKPKSDSSEPQSEAAAAEDADDNEFFGEEEDLPDYLENEEVIEIE